MADLGPHDVAELARRNEAFRRTLVTGEHAQVVLMTLRAGERIGEEVHGDGDQIVLVLEGECEAVLEGEPSRTGANGLVFVPAGTRHDVANAGDGPLRLLTVYAPPEHPDGTVHETKADAAAAEHGHRS